MNNMIQVGIRPPNIFSTFTSQSGGHEKIGFRKKDMYNKINEQRRNLCHNAKGAIEFLGLLALNDGMMYYEHTVDAEGRLQHLFWSDGVSQIDYKLFGEVLAFDATYGKNKYLMPLVVFSGVNHHYRSTIFAVAIVANETEETYVWLLEQFSKCMKGKLSNSVVTNGDIVVKNAIQKVFPNAYHRLCAWHLMRNATSNVKNTEFTKGFENYMLGYFDIGTFRKKWMALVSRFGFEENPWVVGLYENRTMWTTTYLQGNFLVDLGLPPDMRDYIMRKFVNSRYNLSDFQQHFQRCLNHMRFKEKEDDFTSIHGDPVMQTELHTLERYAAKVYTRRGRWEKGDSLVLKRWSKSAKDGIENVDGCGSQGWDAGFSARRATLNGFYNYIDPAGNTHTVWVRNNHKVGLFREGVRQMIEFYGLEGRYTMHSKYNGNRKFDIQIMNSESVEIPYRPLVNQSPPVVAPPPADAPANEENVQNGNMPNVGVVERDVIATPLAEPAAAHSRRNPSPPPPQRDLVLRVLTIP
ncbi:MULE transposase domain [Sesbania bispinosa]|nr:MULE transposase domain [Sesbania bispinosa]